MCNVLKTLDMQEGPTAFVAEYKLGLLKTIRNMIWGNLEPACIIDRTQEVQRFDRYCSEPSAELSAWFSEPSTLLTCSGFPVPFPLFPC